jgi:hypothetical protein
VLANPIVITEGTGVYEGVTGYGSCRVATATEMQSPEIIRITAEGDCSVQIKFGPRPGEPLITGAAASSGTIAPVGSTSGTQREILFGVTFMNDTDETLTGLRLRLTHPAGASVAVALGDHPFEPADDVSWPLPDLQPGEVSDIEFPLQLVSSSRPEIALVAEIDGEGFDSPTLTEPVRVQVVE